MEYDQNVIREAGSNFIKFDDTSAANKVLGTFYEKNDHVHRDYAPVYQIVNPFDGVPNQKKRWFPGEMVVKSINQQKE